MGLYWMYGFVYLCAFICTSETNMLLDSSTKIRWYKQVSEIANIMTKCIMDHDTNRQNHGRTVNTQHPKHGRLTKAERRAHGLNGEHKIHPIAETKKVIISEGDFLQGTRRDTYGHFTVVNNPDRTISVLEPGHSGGCQNQIKSTVTETSKQKSCIVAVNAGFFDPRPGNVCLGNIISDGRVVMKSEGVQNVHFGITNDGFLHFGYLSKAEIADNNYKQLIGGVFWLVRDGQSYLKESINIECQTEEQAEIMEMYAKTILSARSAIGHDKEGRILLMQLDGFNEHKGMTLYEFADVLLDYGFVQAINLDGGGSTTLIINGTLVNHPTDKCENDPRFTCERKVSTILCVHSDHSTRSEENDKSDCDFKNVSNISEHCQSRTIDSNNIKEEVQRDSDNK
ncbi:N-acetylglucosamine-1-phosphodiester alpha-N-acetylglucosaminidase-like isoform X1 [Mytilus trossulus]|uniref:N-acetylglucosamine-1-phosphodiester alpha-N-acetylglucosaminidase-like isoform X1 n=1 Tax=Mytilus trossulus TaxID=6551 RepID=UPI003004882B